MNIADCAGQLSRRPFRGPRLDLRRCGPLPPRAVSRHARHKCDACRCSPCSWPPVILPAARATARTPRTSIRPLRRMLRMLRMPRAPRPQAYRPPARRHRGRRRWPRRRGAYGRSGQWQGQEAEGVGAASLSLDRRRVLVEVNSDHDVTGEGRYVLKRVVVTRRSHGGEIEEIELRSDNPVFSPITLRTGQADVAFRAEFLEVLG